MTKTRKSTLGAHVAVDVAPAEPAPVKPRRENGAAKPRGVVDDFGTRPAGVTHWRFYRVIGDGTRSKDPLEHESTASEMGVSRFPLEELSPGTIRKRWGGGVYKVEFLGPREGKGTCIHLSWGQNVTIRERGSRASAEAPMTPAVAPASIVRAEPPPLDAFVMMDRIEQRVNAQMTGLAQLAAVLAGNNQAAQQLAAQQHNAQLANVLNGIVDRLDRIEAAQAVDDDDDDEEPEEKDLLERGLELFQKYGPPLQAALAFFQQNPNAIPQNLQNGAAADAPAAQPNAT